MLPAYNDLVDQANSLSLMTQVLANVRMIGVSLTMAKLVQACSALARCFRREPGPLAAAALIAGVFLATPHAFFYDLFQS